VELLARLDRTPRSLETLTVETGIPCDTLYGYLKGFLWVGVVSRSKQGKAYCYSFNYTFWPELKEFVTSLQEYQVLRLVPREERRRSASSFLRSGESRGWRTLEYGPQHPITKKLASMDADAQALLQEHS